MFLVEQFDTPRRAVPADSSIKNLVIVQEQTLDPAESIFNSSDTTDVPVEIDNFIEKLPEQTVDDVLKGVKNRLRTELFKATTNRVQGLEYMGYQKMHQKSDNRVLKPARSIGPRCKHTAIEAKSKSSYMCGAFSKQDRYFAFDRYWDLKTWPEKRAYVRGLVTTRDVKRRRKSTSSNLSQNRKNNGHDIYLQKKDGTTLKVCREFFLSTHDIKEDSFKRWTSRLVEENDGTDIENSDGVLDSSFEVAVKKKRKKKCSKKSATPPTKTKGRITNTSPSVNTILEWLELIPKVPSHYCRSSSKRIYVESTFTSIRHMYRVYSDWCTQNEKPKAGLCKFRAILDKEKIAIHSPRKDQCDTCVGHSLGFVDEAEYKIHVERKDAAREKKKKLTESASNDRLVITMDVQSVLLAPKTLASAMYYKQKLEIHNFSIYQMNDRDVHLYVWDESEGGVSSSEFVSCLVDYIGKNKHYKEIVLISDGCTYQNRNRILACALSSAAKEFGIKIFQLILEKGHTMMQVDSVHSTLERLFTPPIFGPTDYYSRMRIARSSQPYKVNILDNSFFKNYEQSCSFSTIRPGKKKGDPVVTDIHQLLYNPDGTIMYTLDYSDDWKQIPHRLMSPPTLQTVPQLHKGRIPIAKSKYDQLQELKSVVNSLYHTFYDELPHLLK